MPRFPRPQVQLPSREAERALFESLEVAAEKNITAEDFGRKTAREALQACLTFLYDPRPLGPALKILAGYDSALDDVDRGTLPEIFDPKAMKQAGAEGAKKWSRSTAARQTSICAAACLGALILKRVPIVSAAATVARAAQNWPRYSKGDIKASTVINWRDELLQLPPRTLHEQVIRG